MSKQNGMMKHLAKLGLLLMMGVSMNADAGWFGFGGTSWKEEVLLHDGSKIIVKRLQSYGGRGEIGQGAPIKEYAIKFRLPNSDKAIEWTSEYSEDVGRANLHPLALHVLKGTPYIVAEPNLCLSYNKWGRPNPPYVIFKYNGKEWQRIAMQELPVEFKDTNLVNNTKDHAKQLEGSSVVTAEAVKRLNSSLRQSEYKTILREPLAKGGGWCPAMISYGKQGGWIGLDWFTDQPSLEACLMFCDHKKVSTETCPCNEIFKGK